MSDKPRPQRLELTWIDKEIRPRLEPRILLEDVEKSHVAPVRHGRKDIFDNMLIFGDNLLALKSLEQKYTGKVKCVYIDPPYNTGSESLRREMKSFLADKKRKPRLTKDDCATITMSVTYFSNQIIRMKYWRYRESGYPIGSGVTEATCKTLVKSRFCGSGARWKDKDASFVLSIRALRLTSLRWQQFWSNIDLYGCPSIPKFRIRPLRNI